MGIRTSQTDPIRADFVAGSGFEAEPGPSNDERHASSDRANREAVVKQFFLYWQERSVLDHASNGAPLDVVASNQLFGVEPGDVVWVVTLDEDRQLYLAGRLKVGEVVEYEEAFRRMPGASLWQAEYYAFPAEGSEEMLQIVPLAEVVSEIRFNSDADDRFHPQDGRITPRQLRSMRELTPESADMIEDIWESRENEGRSWEDLEPAERLALVRELAASEPDNADVQYNLGVVLDENGLTEEAIVAYREAVRLDPGYAPAFYNLGAIYLRLGRAADAVDAFNSAIFAAYKYAPAHFMLGVAYSEKSEHRAAIDATQRGLEFAPDDPAAHFNIGKSHFSLGEFGEALAAFTHAADLDPYFADALYWAGRCHRELGNLESEYEAYKAVIDSGVVHFNAMFDLGTAYARLYGGPRGGEAAYFDLDGDGSIDLKDPRVTFGMGLFHLAIGDFQEARDEREHLREMDAASLGELLADIIENCRRS